jgi:hypothetical protein
LKVWMHYINKLNIISIFILKLEVAYLTLVLIFC